MSYLFTWVGSHHHHLRTSYWGVGVQHGAWGRRACRKEPSLSSKPSWHENCGNPCCFESASFLSPSSPCPLEWRGSSGHLKVCPKYPRIDPRRETRVDSRDLATDLRNTPVERVLRSGGRNPPKLETLCNKQNKGVERTWEAPKLGGGRISGE